MLMENSCALMLVLMVISTCIVSYRVGRSLHRIISLRARIIEGHYAPRTHRAHALLAHRIAGIARRPRTQHGLEG